MEEDIEYNIRNIMSQIRLCLQSIVAGNKKIRLENETFTMTAYQLGGLQNIRIDIKERNW